MLNKKVRPVVQGGAVISADPHNFCLSCAPCRVDMLQASLFVLQMHKSTVLSIILKKEILECPHILTQPVPVAKMQLWAIRAILNLTVSGVV